MKETKLAQWGIESQHRHITGFGYKYFLDDLSEPPRQVEILGSDWILRADREYALVLIEVNSELS